MKKLIESTQSLRQSPKAILDKAAQYVPDKIDTLSGTLQTAPDCFTNAAKLFRTYADAEPYAKLAESYRQVAVRCASTILPPLSVPTVPRYDRTTTGRRFSTPWSTFRHEELFLDRLEAALRVQEIASEGNGHLSKRDCKLWQGV